MPTHANYSISARVALCILVLSFAAVSYLLTQLHASFSTTLLIAMLTGWALVMVYATGLLTNSARQMLSAHRKRKVENAAKKEIHLKTKRLRKQKIAPMKRIKLSNGHVVKLA